MPEAMTEEQDAHETLAEISDAITAGRTASLGLGAVAIMRRVERLVLSWRLRSPQFMAALSQAMNDEVSNG